MKNENTADNKRYLYWIIISVVAIILCILNYFYFYTQISSNSDLITHYVKKDDPMDKYRNPSVAGIFYPSSSQDLDRESKSYLRSSLQNFMYQPKIMIVPHAGTQYSAKVIAQVYQPLKKYSEKIKNVIILGPSHYIAFNGAAVPTKEYFKTPFGEIKVNREWVKNIVSSKQIIENDKPHQKEHSIENQLPFLQKTLDEFMILPISYGDINPQSLAEILYPYIQREDTLLVVSADLTHYIPTPKTLISKADNVRVTDTKDSKLENHSSCGANGISTALRLSRLCNLQPQILTLINSENTNEDNNRIIGYGIQFSDSNSEVENELLSLKDFILTEKDNLLKISRIALEEATRQRHFVPSRKDYNNVLFDKGASFVTLKLNGRLRGCMGSLLPRKAIATDVAENTFKAAMEDKRFKSLTVEEAEKTEILISLLTGFEKIKYTDEQDLLRQLLPDEDGIIIRDGNRQALFLPYVWKEFPDKKDFMHQLKLKAGMSPSYWNNTIKVYRFKTVEIKENGN